MPSKAAIRVGVVGYGVIGKRVAEAVQLQADMALSGVVDLEHDWRMRAAAARGCKIFGATKDAANQMKEAGIAIEGELEDLLSEVDVVVDCTPKKVAAQNVPKYQRRGIKYIVQGGETHEVTGHSFVAEANFDSARGRRATRVVSCNTTSIVRTLHALKRAGLLRRGRGTLMRRATDPWESHMNGMINTILPERKVPSHQGPDAKTVDPELDVVTLAVQVPETLAHLHCWSVQLARRAEKREILEAFATSSRIGFVAASDGFAGLNSVKEFMFDMGRSRADLYEVALWADTLHVEGDELFYSYMVDNQAIVIPETVDAIRALSDTEISADESVRRTNESLRIGSLPWSHISV